MRESQYQYTWTAWQKHTRVHIQRSSCYNTFWCVWCAVLKARPQGWAKRTKRGRVPMERTRQRDGRNDGGQEEEQDERWRHKYTGKSLVLIWAMKAAVGEPEAVALCSRVYTFPWECTGLLPLPAPQKTAALWSECLKAPWNQSMGFICRCKNVDSNSGIANKPLFKLRRADDVVPRKGVLQTRCSTCFYKLDCQTAG